MMSKITGWDGMTDEERVAHQEADYRYCPECGQGGFSSITRTCVACGEGPGWPEVKREEIQPLPGSDYQSCLHCGETDCVPIWGGRCSVCGHWDD